MAPKSSCRAALAAALLALTAASADGAHGRVLPWGPIVGGGHAPAPAPDDGLNWTDGGGDGSGEGEDVEVVGCRTQSDCDPREICASMRTVDLPALPENYSAPEELGVCAFQVPPFCYSDGDCQKPGSVCTPPEGFNVPGLVDLLPPWARGFCAAPVSTCEFTSDCPPGQACNAVGAPLPDGMPCPDGFACRCFELPSPGPSRCFNNTDCDPSDHCWSVPGWAEVPPDGCYPGDQCICVRRGQCLSNGFCAPGYVCVSETTGTEVPPSGCPLGDECICAMSGDQEDVEVVGCRAQSDCDPLDVCARMSTGDLPGLLLENYTGPDDDEQPGVCALRAPPPCSSDEDCEEAGSVCTPPEDFNLPGLLELLPEWASGFCAVAAATCERTSDCPPGDACATPAGPLPDGLPCPSGALCLCVVVANATESCVNDTDCDPSDECWSVSVRAPVPATGCYPEDECICVHRGHEEVICMSSADCADYPGEVCVSETNKTEVPPSGCPPGDECICATPRDQGASTTPSPTTATTETTSTSRASTTTVITTATITSMPTSTTLLATTTAAQPATTLLATTTAAQPATTLRATTTAVQPATTLLATTTALQPATTLLATTTALQPATTLPATTAAVQTSTSTRPTTSTGTSTATTTTRTTSTATTTTRTTSTATTTTRTTSTATTTTRSTTTTTQDPSYCAVPDIPWADVSDCVFKRPPSICVVSCIEGMQTSTYVCNSLATGFSGGYGPFCVTSTATTTTRTSTTKTTTPRPTTTTTTTLPVCVRVPSGAGVDSSDCAGKVAGMQCTLYCRGVYEGDPTVLLCNSVGDFEGDKPVCTKKRCRSGLPDSGYDTGACNGTTAGASCPVSCLPGYVPKKKYFTCLNNGSFSGELPTCTPMYCTQLPSGTGVNSTACRGSRSGDNCTATCKDGYAGEPVGLTCGNDGRFANAAGGAVVSPTCAPKTCSVASLSAPSLEHSCDGVQFGRSCFVWCADGYGDDVEQLDCGGDGPTLSGALPTCVAQNCTRRAPQGDGVTSDCAGKATGETCTASCIAGYEGSGNGTITCTPSGRFSTSALTCSRKACGNLTNVTGFAPPRVENTCQRKVFRQTCSAACGDGFRLTGNASSLRCGAAGAFVNVLGGSGATPPACAAVQCTSGIPSSRGVESDCEGKATGETCTASAAQGYEYQTGTAAATLTCQASGAFQWNAQAVQVVPGRCPSPAWDTGVASSCTDKEVGQTCWAYCKAGYVGKPKEYECDEGLNITAVGEEVRCSKQRRLEAHGATGAPRRLGASCTLASALPAGRASDCAGKADGSTCIVECDVGYTIGTGSPVVYTCSAGTFTWSGSDAYPTCTPIPCTFSLPGGLGVASNCSGVGTGNNCTAYCAAGYTGSPATTPFMCQSTGEFTGTSPTCTALTCNPLSLGAQFAIAACAGKKTGQTCSVACADGYTLAGSPATYTCGTDQNFTGTPPTCNANACTSGVPAGADISPDPNCSSLTTGGTCSVPCATASGYVGTAATYTCTSSGSLVGEYPTCALQTCAALSPPNASYSHTCVNKTVGSSCTVSCAAGYALSPSSSAQTWQCSWDGSAANLQGVYPTCVGLPCTDNVPTGDSVVHNCTGVTTGSACVVSCVPGYTGSAATLTCQASGSLLGSAPTCSKSTCPPVASTASYDASACVAVLFGDVCAVACQAGYGGTPTSLACGLDATNTTVTLSGDVPDCTAETCIYNIPLGDTFSHNCQSVVTGGTCTVRCAAGYAGSPAKFTCNRDNTLTGTVPTCLWVTTTETDTTTYEVNATNSTTMTTTTTTATTTTADGATTSARAAPATTAAAAPTTTAAAATTSTAPATTTRPSTVATTTGFPAPVTSPYQTSTTTSKTTSTTAAPTTTRTTATATSTRTRTSTTKAEPVPGDQVTTILGSMTLSVPNAAAFVADPDAKAGVEAGIAKVANVSAAYVNATLSIVAAAARRLQSAGGGAVHVDYTIALPASTAESQPPIGNILNSLSGADASAMATAINSALADIVPGKYGVAVTALTIPTSDDGNTFVKASTNSDKQQRTAVVVGCVVGIVGGCGCCCLLVLCTRRLYYGRSRRETGGEARSPGAGASPGEIRVDVPMVAEESCN